jgi:hypothetical protein
MTTSLEIARDNLLSPMVLFFLLGVVAAALKSDLVIPEPISKAMSLYLVTAIGFNGGVELSHVGLHTPVLIAILCAIVLSFSLPVLAFILIRGFAGIDRINAAATAAHYGSVSVVTFVAAAAFLTANGLSYEGFLVALLAAMETPAILSGLLLAGGNRQWGSDTFKRTVREVVLSGSIVLILGAFAIGFATGEKGLATMAPLIKDPYKAVLAIFLLDMGLLVGARLHDFVRTGPALLAFGIYMPIIGASLGLAIAYMLGLSLGGATLFAVLAASASYIVVPAAMRQALPQANPAIYLTLSLTVTFPFNLIIGIPIYFAIARLMFAA